jgi:seryl-tRNA synthetase
MDTDNKSDSSDKAIGAQTASTELDSDQVHDAAEQLQASVSRFAQEDEGNQQSVVVAMKQVGAQLQTTDAKVRQNRAEIDKLSSRIRNYRS